MRLHRTYLLSTGLLCLALVLASGAVSTAAPAPTPEDTLVELINAERLNNGGLPPLKTVAELQAAAKDHSANMTERDFMMHCDPDTGTLPWDRMTAAGYTGFTYAAENIAAGYSYSTPQAVVAAWMGSKIHRASILSPTYRELGSGYVFQANDQPNVRQDANGDCKPDSANNGPHFHYWTQNFGQRPDAYPLVIAREAYTVANLQVSLYIYGPSNATQMRFSNDSVTWSAWQSFNAEASWDLSAGNGEKTVFSQVDAGAATYSAQDHIWLDAPPPTAPDVAIMFVDPMIELSWRHAAVNDAYAVYRSLSQPYLAPGVGDAEHIGIEPVPPANGDPISFTVATTAAAAEYYLVRAIAGDGITPADGNRVGRFDFALALP